MKDSRIHSEETPINLPQRTCPRGYHIDGLDALRTPLVNCTSSVTDELTWCPDTYLSNLASRCATGSSIVCAHVAMIEQTVIHEARNGPSRVSAHDLHNLIAVIIAEAQLLQLDYGVDDPRYQSAAAIEQASWRLEALIDRLTVAWDSQPRETTAGAKTQ